MRVIWHFAVTAADETIRMIDVDETKSMDAICDDSPQGGVETTQENYCFLKFE